MVPSPLYAITAPQDLCGTCGKRGTFTYDTDTDSDMNHHIPSTKPRVCGLYPCCLDWRGRVTSGLLSLSLSC